MTYSHPFADKFNSYLCMDSYAGRSELKCEIIGETPKKFKIKLLQEGRLPGRNKFGNVGDAILVPKYSIKFKDSK